MQGNSNRRLIPFGADGGRRLKTSELVSRELTNYILSENLEAGAKLPPEKEMAESFGIARGTLREALRLLETRGIIMLRTGPGGGPVVTRPRSEQLREAWTLLLQFERASLSEVLSARGAIEPVIAREAAGRVTKAQLDELDVTIDKIRTNADNQTVFVEQNNRFHTLIAESSDSIVLRVFCETLQSIWDGTSVGVAYNAPRRIAVADAHERIVAALRAKDGKEAEAQMARHLQEAATYWKKKFPALIDKPVTWLH